MTIKGLMDPGHNREYQNLVREAAWHGMLEALRELNPDQLLLRNEDIIDALIDIQAIMLSTSKQADTTTKLRKECDEYAKRLRIRATAARESAEKDGPLGDIIHLDEMQ